VAADRLATFEPVELVRFLVAIDAELTAPAFMLLIGGGAAALGYGVMSGTKDLDTLTELDTLEAAIARARTATGLDVPISPTGVADFPFEFESRLVRVLPQLARLVVVVPEVHDLVLSKLTRATDGDLKAIEDIHARMPLSYDILVERYTDEMRHAIGDPTRLEGNFLLGIHVLFGELRREDARRRLRQPFGRPQ
jgi:hypothetical protein